MSSKHLTKAILTIILVGIYSNIKIYSAGKDRNEFLPYENSTTFELLSNNNDCIQLDPAEVSALPASVPQENYYLGRQARESLYINDSCKFDFFVNNDGMYHIYKGIYTYYLNNKLQQTIFSYSHEEETESLDIDINISATDFPQNITKIKIKNNLVFMYRHDTLIKYIEGRQKEELSGSTFQNMKKVQGEWKTDDGNFFIFDYPYFFWFNNTGKLHSTGFYKMEESKIHIKQSGNEQLEMSFISGRNIIKWDRSELRRANTQNGEPHRTKRVKIDGHLCVDMGLSILWATQNLNTLVPSDLGGEYRWSGLEPNVSFKRYDIYNGDITHIGPDGEERLNLSNDAARNQWGGKWRMPTKKEAIELVKNSIIFYHSSDLAKGLFIISKINGNYIFLPFSKSVDMYWLSEIKDHDHAYKLYAKEVHIEFSFYNKFQLVTEDDYLWSGGLIRPVIKKPKNSGN